MDDPLAPRIGAIVNARMKSTRFPGKALLPLPMDGDTPVLQRVLERAGASACAAVVVLATSEVQSDDALVDVAAAVGVPSVRGDHDDVLSRVHKAAAVHDLDVVIRVTADNPALDARHVDAAVRHHIAFGADYTSTVGLPVGTNVEVIARAALDVAHRDAVEPEEREHVTPFLRRNPELFHVEELTVGEPGLAPSLRLTLDYPSDYALFQLLYTALPAMFSLTDVAGLLARYPWVAQINAGNAQVVV